MAKKAAKSDFISTGSVAQNRRAHFDYEITEKFTAGLELTGTEVKSLRLGHANINDAYGIEKDGELYISNMFIAEYANKGYESHVEKRDRKLLLKRKEINTIISELSRKGATLVAVSLFLMPRGWPNWKWVSAAAKNFTTNVKHRKSAIGTAISSGLWPETDSFALSLFYAVA